jgi:nitroreductase
MTEKKVSEAIKHRRSVRIYDQTKKIDTNIVKECIEQASLAPTSSNMQLWEFYHITSPEKLKEVSFACFNQPAARTSLQLVIPVVRKDLWRNRVKSNIDFLKTEFKKDNQKDIKKEKSALIYYEKVVPALYFDFIGLIGLFKYISVLILGFFRPIYRQVRSSDLRIVGHKSTALAAQNFMISMSGYGYDTCPMEGFDSKLIKKVLNLPDKAEISMVIGCGIRAENGVYGPRFRVPFKDVYKEK